MRLEALFGHECADCAGFTTSEAAIAFLVVNPFGLVAQTAACS
jgi:hypothetical protein